jgi:GxxExxY protein
MEQRDRELERTDDAVTEQIIGACIEVHRALGPGLLESVYGECLAHELALRGMAFRREVPVPIEYKGVRLACSYRLDIVVEDVVVELKAIDDILSIHLAQLITYLKLGNYRVGLLVNFNVASLRRGVRRVRANSGQLTDE